MHESVGEEDDPPTQPLVAGTKRQVSGHAAFRASDRSLCSTLSIWLIPSIHQSRRSCWAATRASITENE